MRAWRLWRGPSGRMSFANLTVRERADLEGLLGRYSLLAKELRPISREDAQTAVDRIRAGFARLPENGPVELSILIPVHNQLRHTLACIESLVLWPPTRRFEILVGDDASTDGTSEILQDIGHVRVVRNPEAGGFILNCNGTATFAAGRILVLLNNDTIVLPGALDRLVETFDKYPLTGLAGCRLLYPDGWLQEAGSIVWADGSATNVGRTDDPERSAYRYLREVDYCSGAALAIPLALWRQLGGFDTRYRPAYYEDVDLAFRVRAAGYQVLYQPQSVVIHFEGVSHGRKGSAGVKRYQGHNRAVFAERWAVALATRGYDRDARWNCRDRTRATRILVASSATPASGADGGSAYLLGQLRALRELGTRITLIARRSTREEDVRRIEAMGIECILHAGRIGFALAVLRLARGVDAVMLNRASLARRLAPLLKRTCNAARIYNTMDLEFLRERRRARLLSDDAMIRASRKTMDVELAIARASNAIIVISEYERTLMRKLIPDLPVHLVSPDLALSPPVSGEEFSTREGIVFVGNFLHAPNEDAVSFLVEAVVPRLRALGVSAPVHIVGAHPPAWLSELSTAGIVVHGQVHELSALLGRMRVAVAPIRFGAGIKFKTIESLWQGLPIVASPCAVEGTGLRDGLHFLRASTADEFARSLKRLYEDEVFWWSLSAAGRDHCLALYAPDVGKEQLSRLLASLGLPSAPNRIV